MGLLKVCCGGGYQALLFAQANALGAAGIAAVVAKSDFDKNQEFPRTGNEVYFPSAAAVVAGNDL